jgi:dienelactone hydrolase
VKRPLSLGLLALAAAAALAGCGGGGGDDKTDEAPGPFRYNAAAQLGYRDDGVVSQAAGIKVHDVSFASPRGGRVKGYLTVPPGDGPFPAVLFLHGSGGSRLNFVPESSWLAGRRVVGMTIDSPFVRPSPTLQGLAGLRNERNLSVQAVVDVRRAIDVLQSLKQVDDDKIGLLGFSAGAKTAAIASGVDPRIKAAVIVSGGAPTLASFVNASPPSVRPQVKTILGPTDPTRYVGKAKGKLLIQIATGDTLVPQADLDRMATAAGDAQVKRYDGGHKLVTYAPAIHDELSFLWDELGAGKDAVPGALTGPVNS